MPGVEVCYPQLPCFRNLIVCFLCLCVEKNLALQELQQQLQQQLAELTAKHEAAIEAMKTAHCKEVDSLKETFSAATAASAFDTRRAAVATESHGAADVVPFSCGLHYDSALDVRSLKDLAALYHNRCQHVAFLQSKLDAVTEFIAYIDNLDTSADTAKEHFADDLGKHESGASTEDFCAKILAALRTFVLGFRQTVSDFPLQVENFQRLDRYNSQRVQFAVCKSGKDTDELSCQECQLVSGCLEDDAVSVGLVAAGGSEDKASLNVELPYQEHKSQMHSRTCYDDAAMAVEYTDGGIELRKEIVNAADVEEAAVIAMKLTQEMRSWNEGHLNHSDDTLNGQFTEQRSRQLELQTAALMDAVSELSQHKDKTGSRASEMSKLSTDAETDQAALKEDCDSKTAELGTVAQRLYAKTAELAQLKELYETKTAQLSWKIDELQNRLQLNETLSDAERTRLTYSHSAALEAKDAEVAKLKVAIDNLKETLTLQQDEQTSVLLRKEEMICLAEERHRSELAGMVDNFEKRISELKCEHDRTVEEHRERIAQMEQSDIELNTQLMAVTEKFNSVTEYTTSTEQLIDDYQSKLDSLSAEREGLISAAETASSELLLRDAEIAALKEQIQLLKQPPSVPVVSVKNEEVAVINCDNSKPPVIGNSAHTSLHGPESETTYNLNNTQHENVELQHESFYLTGQVNEQWQCEETGSVREQAVEQLKWEHRAAIQHLEDEHNAKVIQLVKDFNAEMAAHETELRATMNSDFGL